MAGFDNNVMYADNVDFTGSTSPTAQVLNDGELLIGSTAAPNIQVGTLTGGTGVTISNGSGAITINATGGGFTGVDVTGTSQGMAVDTGYQANNAGLVTLTLPAAAAFGEVIRVAGLGAGGWTIAQNAGQTIHFGNQDTTTGVGGSLASTNRYDSLELLCSVANNEFTVLNSVGNLTVV